MPAMFGRIARSPSMSMLVLLGAFVAGVAAHAFDERRWTEPSSLVAAASLAMPLAAAFRSRAARLALAAFALVTLGIARYDAALPAGPVEEKAPPAGQAWFTGTVAEEPRDSLKGTVLVMDRVFVSGRGAGEKSTLAFRAPVDAAPGDELSWRCRMRTRDAAMRGRDGDVPWSCFPDALPRVGRAGGWSAAAGLLGFKRAVRSLAGELLPEPDSSLLLGLLIGDRGGIPPDLIDAFRTTGTSHVLAVSGYNVHQVVELAFVLCAAFAVKRRAASWAVAAPLAFFVALTGGDAPVVRAAFMGGMGLVAGLIGRRNAGFGPLAIAAALMLAHDPLILRHDVGFRLSFAAVAGMRAFGPLLAKRLTFLPAALGVRAAAADTLGATAGTLPIALHDFGMLPFASPLVNVAIAPLVPLIMATGAASMAVGALALPLAAPIAFACELLSRLMTGIVGVAASVAPVLEARASTLEAAALYAGLALLRFGLGRPAPPRRPAAEPGVVMVTYVP